jgi:hypothetical protein
LCTPAPGHHFIFSSSCKEAERLDETRKNASSAPGKREFGDSLLNASEVSTSRSVFGTAGSRLDQKTGT